MFLQYSDDTRLVVGITELAPAVLVGYSVVESDIYALGDEFELSIYILALDEDGNISEHASIRNNPNAARLLFENAVLKQENASFKERFDDIEMALADLFSV